VSEIRALIYRLPHTDLIHLNAFSCLHLKAFNGMHIRIGIPPRFVGAQKFLSLSPSTSN